MPSLGLFLQSPEAAVHEQLLLGHSKSPKVLTPFPSPVVKTSNYSIKRAANQAPVSRGHACVHKKRDLVSTLVSCSRWGEDVGSVLQPTTAALVPLAARPASKRSG